MNLKFDFRQMSSILEILAIFNFCLAKVLPQDGHLYSKTT